MKNLKLFIIIDIHLCSLRYAISGCLARLHSIGDEVIKQTIHSHAADLREEPVRFVMSNIRKDAAASNESTKRVIAENVSKIKHHLSSPLLPNKRQMTRSVQHVRAEGAAQNANPATLAELKIDGENANTIKSDNFVLFDNNETRTQRMRILNFWSVVLIGTDKMKCFFRSYMF